MSVDKSLGSIGVFIFTLLIDIVSFAAPPSTPQSPAPANSKSKISTSPSSVPAMAAPKGSTDPAAKTGAKTSPKTVAKPMTTKATTPDSSKVNKPQIDAQAPNAPTLTPTIMPSAGIESRGGNVTEPSHTWAAGLNLGWLSRRDFGAQTFRRFHPEIVGYRYGILPFEDWFWRGGVRFGYSAHQPEMPQSVRIIETDTSLYAEGSIIREWYVVLSGTLGVGNIFRKLTVKTDAPIEVVDSRLNRSTRLNVTYIQLGAGLPINQGRIMIEPLARYQITQFDDRSKWLAGIEFTYGW